MLLPLLLENQASKTTTPEDKHTMLRMEYMFNAIMILLWLKLRKTKRGFTYVSLYRIQKS